MKKIVSSDCHDIDSRIDEIRAWVKNPRAEKKLSSHSSQGRLLSQFLKFLRRSMAPKMINSNR